jgi:hypothetical protein
MNETSFPVSWRGRQSGPYSTDEIRRLLQSGEISGLHLVMTGGKWITVDEFLPALTPAPPPMAPTRHVQRPEPAQPPAETMDDTNSFPFVPPERRVHSPRGAAPDVPPYDVSTAPYPQHVPGAPPWTHYGGHPLTQPARTSGMAVAAFVCALVSIFVSVLWPIALLLWLLSLVLGHTAISNCRSDPTLRGKGLAVAAVSISYVILALSLVLGALIALRNS